MTTGSSQNFGDSALWLYMDVRRLALVRTEKDKTIWAILKYCRHSDFIRIMIVHQKSEKSSSGCREGVGPRQWFMLSVEESASIFPRHPRRLQRL
jgi:hypothetical protein